MYLHDADIMAVHARAVSHTVHGRPLPVTAKQTHGRGVICGEGKWLCGRVLRTHLRLRGDCLFRRRYRSRFSLICHISLYIFFSDLLHRIDHEVKQGELIGVMYLLSSSGHVRILTAGLRSEARW